MTSIMEVLKQIQRDHKNDMKNLHDMNTNINTRLNVIEGKMFELHKNLMECKITALDKKIDDQGVRQRQILGTIDRLEQQIRKNNMLLFGNDETEINFEDITTQSCKHDLNDMKNTDHGMKQSANVDTTQLQNPPNVEFIEDKKSNCEDNNKSNDSFHNTDNREEILNELSFIGTGNIDETENIHSEEAEAISLGEKDTIKTSTYFSTYLVKLDNKLNKITNMYQTDMKELEQLIMDIVAEIKISVEEAVNVVYTQDTEQIYNTYMEFKEIAETNNCAMKDIKEVIKNYVTTKMPVQETARAFRVPKVVQISPTYFSADQLSKLNNRLRIIGESCQETDVIPIIEVLSDADEHPIIKQLIEGVYYEKIDRYSESLMFIFKFGTCDSEKLYIIDVIGRYPNLSFNEVVKICLIHCNKWEAISKIFDLTKPMIHNERGDLVRLIMK